MEETQPTQTQPTEEQKPTQSTEKAPQGPAKPPNPTWLFYILSAVIPLVGIILGIVYMTKEGEEVKKFGKICLTVGIIFALIPCICWLVMVLFGGGLSFFGDAVTTNTYTY
ncbi:hypothetical protein KKH43_01045 [Patescibacteria group bacterium]|nr:hypothetical protein [Patescibacteria group bacterium]